MLADIQNEIKNNARYLLVSGLISLLTIMPRLLMALKAEDYFTSFLLILFLFAIGQYSKIIFSIFILYFNFVNIIQANIFIHWGRQTSLLSRFEVAVRSPLYETLEYLSAFVDYRDVLVILYALLILVGLFKFLKMKKHYRKLWIISFVLSIILYPQINRKEPINVISQYLKARRAFIDTKVNLVLDPRNKFLKDYNKHRIKHKTDSLFYDKIIIIQGEAANKNYMNVYGYHKKTTPFLSNLAKNNKVFLFDCISPTNQTRYSIPCIYTNATVLNWKQNFINSPSILSDFSDFGYRTYWISNQGKIGKHDDWVTNIATEADQQKFFNQGRYSKAKSDIVFSNYLKNRKENTRKEMFVFHLIGSHSKYTKRYINPYVLHKHPTDIYEEYENTIFFTDHILKEIYKHFRDSGNVLIIYISDHGELLGKNKHGHGFLPTYKDEYDIPLIIFSNINNKRIEKLKRLNQQHYFNAENMNYLIKYISGISNKSKISYSPMIFSLKPKNVFNYDSLHYYK